MKKILVALILAVGLVACGEETPTESASEVVEELQEEVQEEVEEESEYPESIGTDDRYLFNKSVHGDNTGNIRTAVIYSADTVEDFIGGYVEGFFKDDNEIHAVCNLALNTTARIIKLSDNLYDVTVFEYVKSEENKAELLFTGMIYQQYWYHADTGELEVLE